MNHFIRRALFILLSAIMTFALLAPAGHVEARGNPNPGVIPPNARYGGLTYSEWNSAWWQWIFSIPADRNPLFDATGANCAEGQSGHVWFLAGSFVGPVTRNCTVPTGKALFIPIINAYCDTAPPPSGSTYEELLACVQGSIAQVSVNSLQAEIDGAPLHNLSSYLSTSPPPDPFTIVLPENNLYGLPAGFVVHSVAFGYYLMLTPLPAGSHTIHVYGEAPAFGFTSDVTYNLRVR
jgi:hypothetical protein